MSQVTEPRLHKIRRPGFPNSLHTLQADIRISLDKLRPVSSPDSGDVCVPDTSYGEVVSLEDKVDAQIRLAFADFLLGEEMLGLIENHLAIYRLFPRPVVSLKLSSFMKAYSGKEEFMRNFIRSQVCQTQSLGSSLDVFANVYIYIFFSMKWYFMCYCVYLFC